MIYGKEFFEKVFSEARMRKYFSLYPDDEAKAIGHYECNILLSESFYPCLSVVEVAVRNALSMELVAFAGRTDWYTVFSTTPGLNDLNKYISQAIKSIVARNEMVNSSKITAELTMGFWTSLLNRNYERILWKDLRRAFPFMPKKQRQRKNIASYLNRIRHLRNRIDHSEPICWNLDKVDELHSDIILVMGWINKDIPEWTAKIDRFYNVISTIRQQLSTNNVESLLKKQLNEIQALDINSLSAMQLFDILKLRQDVFFVEEKIIYPDLDGIDKEARHVFTTINGEIASYARVYWDCAEKRVKIGRVVTAAEHRGKGLASEIIRRCVEVGKKDFNAKEIWLDAQIHAVSFYESLGFKVASGRFMEAGIEHVRMVKA